MKNQSNKILGLGILIAGIILLMSAAPKPSANNMTTMNPPVKDSTEELKAQALKVLETRCNVCHKKKESLHALQRKEHGEKSREDQQNGLYHRPYAQRRHSFNSKRIRHT